MKERLSFDESLTYAFSMSPYELIKTKLGIYKPKQRQNKNTSVCRWR